MKTKAYSKEGLTNSTRLDPREKEKVETCNFVQEMLEELERQKEALEAEQETIQATIKKKSKDTAKQDRISEIEDTLDRHKWHTGKLESVLRMLENGAISPDTINSIQDDIRYYVESNQDVDFAEDEEIYDELNLDEEDMEGESYIRDDTPSYSLEDLASEHNTTKDSTHLNNSHKHDLPLSNSSTHSSTSSRKGSIANTLSPVISHSHVHSNVTPTTVTSGISSMKPAPPPVRSTNELKYASAAAAGSSITVPHGISPLPPPSGAPSASVTADPLTSEIPAKSSPITTTITASHATEKTENKSKDSDPLLQPSTASNPGVESDFLKEEPSTKTINDSYKLPPGLQDLINSFDSARHRIGNPLPIASISKMLESSYLNCPDSFIANTPKYYQPEDPFPTPSCYPQEPMASLNFEGIFPKMELDTLFYIFYYRQGTYQQFLAAKELKNRSWRFHKRFLTWFQRHEEPKVINNDYEQGTYRYFDFEGMWLQRRKSNFKFEYQFLEDE